MTANTTFGESWGLLLFFSPKVTAAWCKVPAAAFGMCATCAAGQQRLAAFAASVVCACFPTSCISGAGEFECGVFFLFLYSIHMNIY